MNRDALIMFLYLLACQSEISFADLMFHVKLAQRGAGAFTLPEGAPEQGILDWATAAAALLMPEAEPEAPE